MDNQKIKVCYIAGEGRSGSTILGNILGQVEGFFFASELRSIWDKAILENTFCGCGLRLHECQIWKAILTQAFGEDMVSLAQEMVRLRRTGLRSRHILLAKLSKKVEKLFVSRMSWYLQHLKSLYLSIQQVSGCKVIIDSSGNMSYAYLLGMLPSVELYILHLIRDARGVAYSWTKQKRIGDTGEYMFLRSPLKSATLWLVINAIGELLQHGDMVKYSTIRYEDFIEKPVQSLESILSFLSEQPSELPFVDGHSVALKMNHGIWGSPNRFQGGVIELRRDDEWIKKMKKIDKTIVTILALPLLMKYRYL